MCDRIRLIAMAVAAVCMLSTVTAVAADASWQIATSQNEAPVLPEVLEAASCISASFCMAVGQYAEFPPPSSPANQTLIEEWNGSTWAIVASPSPSQIGVDQPFPSEVGNYLSGVSCTDPDWCVAVGYEYTPSQPSALVEQWDGDTWSLATAPDPSGSGDFLDGVSCVARDSCVAVGYQLEGSTYQLLEEAWDGSRWSVMTSPSADAGGDNTFNGVSCTTSGFCMAGGWTCDASQSACAALFATWNGTAWSLSAAPPAAAPYTYVYGVSCAASSVCAAAGSTYDPSTNSSDSLLMMWNGLRWAYASSSDSLQSSATGLTGVACGSADLCVAVGANYGGSDAQTLIDQWDGAAWSTVVSPDAQGTATGAATSNALYGAGCSTDGFCVATGAYNAITAPTTAISQTLIEQANVSPETSVAETPWVPAVPLLGLVAAVFAHRRRRAAKAVIT